MQNSDRRRISGKSTRIYKKWSPYLFPAGGVVGLILLRWNPHSPVLSPITIGLLVLLMLGLGLAAKRAYSGLVDAVYDFGDRLLVRNNAEEDTILLSDISSINFPVYTGIDGVAPKITLTLRKPCRFGKNVAFIARIEASNKSDRKLVDDLVARTGAIFSRS